MQITLEDVKFIINEYNQICKEEDANAVDWCLDDNNVGISYDYRTLNSICQEIAYKFNKK